MVLLNYTVGIYGVVIIIIQQLCSLATNVVLLPTTTVFLQQLQKSYDKGTVANRVFHHLYLTIMQHSCNPQ